MNQTILRLLNTLKLSVWGPLSILMFLSIGKSVAQCNPRQDSLVLVQLYDSTNGPQWLNTLRDTAKWKVKGIPIGKWYGVSVDTAGCVTRLSLSSDSLKGTLPASLTTLSALRSISFGSNNISGQIPNFNSPSLEQIWLYNNQLSATIPNFKLSNLKYLWLSDNQLSGAIPNFDLPKVEDLWLQDNKLTGQIPNFNLLTNLLELKIDDNQLSGTIPNFNLKNLQKLSIRSNKLTGSIPNFNLPKLIELRIGYNELKGLIPIFDLPNLEYLWLNNNQLSGQIPKLYLPKLTSLELYNNKLTGCIPRELKTNCPLLGIISGGLSGNSGLTTESWINYWRNFEGACPPTDTTKCRYRDSVQLVALYDLTGGANWNNKWTLRESLTLANGLPNTAYWYGITRDTEGCVTEIRLDSNNLRGRLPNFNMLKLRTLTLTFNQLSGAVPNFNLPELRALYLSRNQLTGRLPNFDSVPNLQQLYLNENSFKGSTIPNFDKLTNLINLDLSLTQITGTIPSFNKLTNLKALLLSGDSLRGTIPNFNLPELLTLRLNGNQLEGVLPELKVSTKLTDIQMHNNKLTGCFPMYYLQFCTSISDSSKRNFNNNIGLGLENTSGNFSLFCRTPFVSNIKTKAIYLGDTLHRNGQIERPQVDTIYRDTSFLPDCKVGLNILKVTVTTRDTLSTTLKIAVTPDGDGINEQFDLQEFVDWSLYPNSELNIFNRWGQKVYTASPYNRDWVGQSTSGSPLLDGDYLFILRLELNGRTLKGSIYLKR